VLGAIVVVVLGAIVVVVLGAIVVVLGAVVVVLGATVVVGLGSNGAQDADAESIEKLKLVLPSAIVPEAVAGLDAKSAVALKLIPLPEALSVDPEIAPVKTNSGPVKG
jgi:hypothetical protein